jgi:hypothetical protein
VVFPLEGLWWVEDMREFSIEHKDNWLWTVMIRQPEWVNAEHIEESILEIRKKKKDQAPHLLSQVRFKMFNEGLCAHIMHIGPFAAEVPTIQRLHRFILESGYKLRDKHHEIYMSDPRKTTQEKLKTVIRQPVVKA